MKLKSISVVLITQYPQSGDLYMSTTTDTRTWPELAIGLYDQLTERNAEIAYDFADFEIGIPSSTQGNAEHARWKLNGRLCITTKNGA